MKLSLKKVLLENLTDSYQIYCDMDGTLTDFEGRFEHFTGIIPSLYKSQAVGEFGEKIGMDRFWDVIDNQVGIRFWRGMGWMPEGRELWDYIKPHKPKILTAPSRHPSSREGKQMWVKENLGDFEVIFKNSESKSQLAKPNHILIDDRPEIINSWKVNNGIGILYVGDTNEVIRELNKLGI